MLSTQGQIKPVKLGGAISVIFSSEAVPSQRETFGGLAPQTKLQDPQIELLSIINR